MMDGPEPKRLRLSKVQLEGMTKEEIIDHWMKQEYYVDILETKAVDGQKDNSELVSLRESEEKMKQQQSEATRRENVLVMRLTTKEQEMQEYANQIQELKQAQVPGSTQLRSTLLDPAVNLMFERTKKELDLMKAKLEETQNDLSAWKFTPDSNTGKRLMHKCRVLHQENEDLGKIVSSGRVAKLEGDLALQRNFSEEMKKSQAELDEFLMELDEDVEGMQSTIYFLQQQLRESKEQIAKLQQEIECAKTLPEIGVQSPKSLVTNNSNHTSDINEILPDAKPVEVEDSHIKANPRTPDSAVGDHSNQNKISSPSLQVENSPRMNGDSNDQQLSPQFRTSKEEPASPMDVDTSLTVTVNNISSELPNESVDNEENRTPLPHSPINPTSALPDAHSPEAKDENWLEITADNSESNTEVQDEFVVAETLELVHSPHTPPDPPPGFELQQVEPDTNCSNKTDPSEGAVSMKCGGDLVEGTDHNYEARTENNAEDSKWIEGAVNGVIVGSPVKIDGEADA